MEIAGYLGAVVMGFTLGLLGGGGSILSVPIFVYLFAIPPTLATAYSLFVVGLAALVGGFRFLKMKQVDFHTGFIFAVPAFIGVFAVRKFLMPAIPFEISQFGNWLLTRDMLIMLVFAVVMLLAAVSMIRSKSRDGLKKQEIPQSLKYSIIGIEGLVVGGVTGFVGAGGGFLIVPALVLLTGLEMKVAVGTSLFIIAAKSLIGFTGDVMNQSYIDWVFLAIFTALSIVGIFVGAHFSQKVPQKTLKTGFGWFVLVMGIFILAKQIV